MSVQFCRPWSYDIFQLTKPSPTMENELKLKTVFSGEDKPFGATCRKTAFDTENNTCCTVTAK